MELMNFGFLGEVMAKSLTKEPNEVSRHDAVVLKYLRGDDWHIKVIAAAGLFFVHRVYAPICEDGIELYEGKDEWFQVGQFFLNPAVPEGCIDFSAIRSMTHP